MDELISVLNNISFRDGGWVMLIPTSLMAIDILTGIVHAWSTGHLKSYRMREGLGRKFGEISILFVFQIFTYGLYLPAYVLSGTSIYIMFMECISICENLKKLGVPIPRFVDKALESMNNAIQNIDLNKKNKNEEKERDE